MGSARASQGAHGPEVELGPDPLALIAAEARGHLGRAPRSARTHEGDIVCVLEQGAPPAVTSAESRLFPSMCSRARLGFALMGAIFSVGCDSPPAHRPAQGSRRATDGTIDRTSIVSAPRDSAAQAPSTPQVPRVQMQLEIDALDVRVDEANRKVVWTTGTHVKRATQSEYRFDYGEYVSVVGATNLTGDLKLDAACSAPVVHRAPAPSPALQQPIGGFVVSTYECVPIRVVPAR